MQPDNVLVTEFLRAKISDFGTSYALSADSSDDVAMAAVGTPLFCAPEIMRGEAYNASADVYSFGLLLLAMVYGTMQHTS
jgi:serine/threonine protein kinase